MKNLKKVVALFAALSMMAGCSSSSKTEESSSAESEPTYTYAKIGMGIISNATDTQTNSTVAVVGLNENDQVIYCKVDVAQLNDEEDADTRTKVEKGDDYGMVAYGVSDKEWYEQAEAFENYVVENTMTKEDVLNIETYEKDEEHNSVPAEGTDLASGCTINIGDFQEAVAEAIDNAVECECNQIGLGIVSEVEQGSQTDATCVALGLNDGKVVKAQLDVAQIQFAGDDMRSKLEKGDDYGMVAYGVSDKEWYQQAEAFDEYIVGMTKDDVLGIETYEKDEEHNSVPAEGTDLASGCTINIGDFQEAAAKAFDNAE